MLQTATTATSARDEKALVPGQAMWAVRATLLWNHRGMLLRVTMLAFLVSLGISLIIPKEYKSTASIMPPDQQNSTSALMLAALGARSGGLSLLNGLAGSLLGAHTTTALFVDLLRSGTVSSHLIDRFDLQHVYHKRYRIDTAKHLARITKITDDKKSGVITIEVEDTDRVRARDLAQGYLDELNKLVTQTNTSAAHRERLFIEQRLHSVQVDLESAQLKLSDFSSRNSTVDIKEQMRAMVDAGARVQGELLVEQSSLEGLRQIYGDGNVRVRETEARVASLRSELEKMAGSSAPLVPESDSQTDPGDKGQLYPPLRQLPRLGVPYADLYRRVQVQETVFELLTQQYELARIEEAKDVPVVSVIDPPGIAEKKSFPPRALLTLLLTFLCFAGASAFLIARDRWVRVDLSDPRKALANEVLTVMRKRQHSIFATKRGAL